MPIRIKCTDCCSELKFPDEVAGQQVRCPTCDAKLVAPGRARPRPADNPGGAAPARQEGVRATRPAQAVEEPVRPKRPAAAAEERVRATRPAAAEERVRATRPARPDVGPEAEAPKAGREPPAKKKRQREPQPGRASSAWIWWLAGGGAALSVLIVGAVVVAVALSMKPGAGGARKAQPAAEPEDGWADAKTAAQFVGPDPERVANMMSIYRMNGECRFARDAEHTVVGLRMHSPHATDSFLSVVRGYPKLEYLDLSQCRVTDDGVQQLLVMRELKQVNLKRTLVTVAGVRTLYQALPNTNIDY